MILKIVSMIALVSVASCDMTREQANAYTARRNRIAGAYWAKVYAKMDRLYPNQK